MQDFKDYWNETHTKYSSNNIVYDDWLDKYQDVLKSCKTKILDLGCGVGNDTLYLLERGYKVLSCDYSEVALNSVKTNIKNSETKQVDISKPLPFEYDSFDIIIADLSLHYFDDKTTKEIMKEIKRVLTKNGILLARVNSVADKNHGAGQGIKLEDNFYFVEEYNKRFFTKEDAIKYFSIIGDVVVNTAQMTRYTKPKELLEIKVVKKVV